MTCQSIINENNYRKPCWFPIDPESPFQTCTRCHYYEVQEILSQMIKGDFTVYTTLQHVSVQKTCLKKELRERLQEALVSLCLKQHPQFSTVYSWFSNSVEFHSFLSQQTIQHFPSNRCCLYKKYLKERTLDREAVITDVPSKCLDCVGYILRQKTCLGMYSAITKAFLSPNYHKAFKSSSINTIIDLMVSAELLKKSHLSRLILDQYQRTLPESTKKKNLQDLLVQFLAHPAVVHQVFTESFSEYIPLSLKDKDYKIWFRKEVLKQIRKRNWVFKEELIMRTWAPRRLFPWCLDIEELKDFEPIDFAELARFVE